MKVNWNKSSALLILFALFKTNTPLMANLVSSTDMGSDTMRLNAEYENQMVLRAQKQTSYERVATMILLPFWCIHPNEMIFSVISEWRKRGCQPTSKFVNGWTLNYCNTDCYIKEKVVSSVTCLCDSDLCGRNPTYGGDCSEMNANGEPKHQLSMALESPHDEVQWKFEVTKPGPELDFHRRSSTQVDIVVIKED